MVKNVSVCQSCPFKNKVELEKNIFSEHEENIQKTRAMPDGAEKNNCFSLIIKNCLNEIEIFSCLNCLGAAGEDGQPDPDKLSMYYCLHGNGAKLLGEKKFTEILAEVTGSYNEFFTGIEIKRRPDVWDDFKHYVLNNGLEDYYKKHLEHVPPEQIKI